MTLGQIARGLARREYSAVELATETLRGIRKAQPVLNAFVTVTEEVALAQARQADQEMCRGIRRSPLRGIPYAVSDCFLTGGAPTTGGSRVFETLNSTEEATCVRKLRQNGAVLVGKTVVDEFGCGFTSNNPHFGPVRNPSNHNLASGGACGGSAAAVAAGLVPFALGSDISGCIRLPSAFCGCVGFKPTLGRVSRYGVLQIGYTLEHVGPLARTVADVAAILDVISGLDQRDSGTIPYVVRDADSGPPWRIGIPTAHFSEGLSETVSDAYREALRRIEDCGAVLIPVKVPDPRVLVGIGRTILLSEMAAVATPYLSRRDLMGADTLDELDRGLLIPAVDYVNAMRRRRGLQAEWGQVWNTVDFLITPTSPMGAPLIGERLDRSVARFVCPFNVLGYPAVSMPVESPQGVPVGLQLIGRPAREPELTELCKIIEGRLHPAVAAQNGH